MMESLPQYDSFGSGHRNMATVSSIELSRSSSSSHYVDKGKARARDHSEDDSHFSWLSAGEPSASSSVRPPNYPRITDDEPDIKGKGKQQAFVCDQADCVRPNDSTAGMSSAISRRRTRKPADADISQSRWSAYHQDDGSLKRSIHQLGSSPSSSPNQQPSSPPILDSFSSTSSQLPNDESRDASTSSHIQAASSGSSSSRPNTANKKRRSDRLSTAVQDDGNASYSSYANSPEIPGRQVQEMTSTNPGESSQSLSVAETVVAEASPSFHPSIPDPSSGARFRSRRTSLLLNSSTSTSTSSTRSLVRNNNFCVSPEPINRQTRRDDSISERLQQRRSAFLDEHPRANRSSGTIRRRRGFYIRDADPVSAETLDDHVAPVSASSSDSFMSEFARAVDLRLGPRFESVRSSVTSLNEAPHANIGHADMHSSTPSVMSQRNAPQLPYVRAASPLTIPFTSTSAESDGTRTFGAGRQRRLVPLTHRDQVEQSQRDGGNAPAGGSSTERFWWPEHESGSLLSANTDVSGRLGAVDRSLHAQPNRAWPSGRDDVAGQEIPSGRRNRMPLSRDPTYLEQLDLGPLDGRSGWQRFDSNRNEAAADPSSAARPAFEQQVTGQSIRRRFRLGSSGGAGASDTREGTFSARESQQSQRAAVPERARNAIPQRTAPDRGADDWHDLRNTLPWRRSHFGIRPPSNYRDRDAPATAANSTPAVSSTTRPRFEPFTEPSSSDSRQPTSPPTSRAPRPGSLRHERNENESALEYLGRLMSRDSILDGMLATTEPHDPLRMAIESELLPSHPYLRNLGYAPASTSNAMLDLGPRLAFDARNFIADEDWAELNSYEGLMGLSERLGTAEICVPQSLIDSLPTCEYGKWDGGSCRQPTPEVVGKGKGKGKQTGTGVGRDTMCPICREDYLDSDLLMSINGCCHAFHAECIKVSSQIPLM